MKVPKAIAASFSLYMIDRSAADAGYAIEVIPLTPAEAQALAADVVAQYPANAAQGASCIAYPDTAAVLSTLLGVELRINRSHIKVGLGDSLLVVLLDGPKLKPFATEPTPGTVVRYLELCICAR
jgi:hypothetical protein